MADEVPPGGWHPRIVVSGASALHYSLEQEVALYRELGVRRVSLLARKIADGAEAEAARLVRDAGCTIDNLMVGPVLDLAHAERWEVGRAALRRALERARALGTATVIVTSGPAGRLTWEEAADAFAEAIAPVVAEARRDGATVAVENTNGLRFDLGFLHTLRDTIDVARRVGIQVCMEINNVWGERALRETIASGADLLRTVQVNDFVVGTTSTPDRAVPGDGDIPLERIVRDLEGAGYRGPYEIEIVGPRIEAEGYPSALRRSLVYLDRLLRAAGA